jgi:hypothetical protein
VSLSHWYKASRALQHAFIKNKQELATVPRPQTLNGMRIPGREEPEVAFGHVIDEDRSIGIQNRDASIAGEHNGPFIRRMPMQFAEAAAGEPHVDPGELC